jgi:MFS family permease
MWNDYVATILSLCFGAIAFLVLLLALVAELFERSRVPRFFFYAMSLSAIAPALVSILFVVFIKHGNLDWRHLF